ncbi:hypothetical protein [uncultured Porphyromonas sp.]|uniref:hypothetical protein n=1 Tax=uncultured Porphyromonas sp. TaxID=159274 RepID=UPI00262F2420|nr:hypothetical protein [uncultured Porphyromonas sp.]
MMRIPMRLTLLALLLCVSSALYAQQSQRETPRPSRQDLSQVQAAYIAKQLGFDEATTRRFVELYAKQQQEIWALSPRDKATKGARTDAEAERAIKDYFERSEQLLSIRKKYYQEFRNFLTPQQIERIYKLDRSTIEGLRQRARSARQTYDSTMRYMGDSLRRVYKLDRRVIEELRRQARDLRQSYDSTLRYMGDSLRRVYKLDRRVIEELRRQARDLRQSYDSIQHQMGDQLERARRFYRGRR